MAETIKTLTENLVATNNFEILGTILHEQKKIITKIFNTIDNLNINNFPPELFKKVIENLEVEKLEKQYWLEENNNEKQLLLDAKNLENLIKLKETDDEKEKLINHLLTQLGELIELYKHLGQNDPKHRVKVFTSFEPEDYYNNLRIINLLYEHVYRKKTDIEDL